MAKRNLRSTTNSEGHLPPPWLNHTHYEKLHYRTSTQTDDGKPGYVKCYKLGGRWKSVATQAQASKFTHEIATWKCKSLNHPECPAFFFVEPLDSSGTPQLAGLVDL